MTFNLEDEPAVPGGAITDALSMIEALHGRDDRPPHKVQVDAAEAVDRWGRDTLDQAFSQIIYAGVYLILGDGDDEQSTEDDGDKPDSFGVIMPAIINHLARLDLPEVPRTALPTVAGILTAAFYGQPPYVWRSRLGRTDDEHLVWLYTAWVMVDFMDKVMFEDKPGRFTDLLTTVLLSDEGEPGADEAGSPQP